MISKQAVEEQLKRIGFNFRLWGRAEVNELGRILLDDEIIAECVNGEYDNGFALLVATNHRVLLVDKKPMLYLTVEDIRYDMITEFNLSHRLMQATIRLYTPNKTLIFNSWNQPRLRRLLEYTQQRVLEMRQQNHMSQQFQAAAAAQYAQLHAANYYQQPQSIGAGNPSYAPNLEQQAPTYQEAQVQTVANPPYYGSDQSGQGGQGTGMSGPTAQTPVAPTATAPAVARTQEQTAAHGGMITKLVAKRTALGTYTRSKLPAFRLHHDKVDNATPAELPPVQTGEVYPQGYAPGQPVTNFGLPYEY